MAKPSWVTLSKSSGSGGGSVNVTASRNTGSSARSGTLTIKTASGLTKTVSVSQNPSTYTIHFRGSLIFKNRLQDLNNLPRINLYARLRNIDGDFSELFEIGASTMSTIPYNEADEIPIELDQVLNFLSDQEPFIELDFLQLQTEAGLKNLDGNCTGTILIKSFKSQSETEVTEIASDFEMTEGRLDPVDKISINPYYVNAEFNISNNLNSALEITNYY